MLSCGLIGYFAHPIIMAQLDATSVVGLATLGSRNEAATTVEGR